MIAKLGKEKEEEEEQNDSLLLRSGLLTERSCADTGKAYVMNGHHTENVQYDTLSSGGCARSRGWGCTYFTVWGHSATRRVRLVLLLVPNSP
eukprot:1161989-Rhodomonas_salina.2